MPGRMTTSLKSIEGLIQQKRQNVEKVLLNIFCEAGEECIIEARNGGSYIDRTGNLRSSIGYAVLKDGKVYQQEQVERTLHGGKGLSEGAKFLEQKVRDNDRKGIVLIVTAGMNYAEYVEAKGRVVLSSAELKAPNIVRELLTSVGFELR